MVTATSPHAFALAPTGRLHAWLASGRDAARRRPPGAPRRPPTATTSADRITVTWNLSARGRDLDRQSGGNGATVQQAIITAEHPSWLRALPLAQADRAGRWWIEVDHDPLSGHAYAFDSPVSVETVLEAAEVLDATRWALTHGSDRLRRLATQRLLYVCMPLYFDERLAADRPGWTWPDELAGIILDPPTNPVPEAVTLLDQARRVDPTARLRCWRLAVPDMLDPTARPAGSANAARPDQPILASCYAVLGYFHGRTVIHLGPPCDESDLNL